MGGRWVFDGHIAGIGTGSGLRAVVGIWQESPFGPFADAMVQLPSGRRILLAPAEEVAEFIAATYSFEEVRVVDVSAVLAGQSLTVDAGPLALRASIGGRALLGSLLRAVPRPVAVNTRWLTARQPARDRSQPRNSDLRHGGERQAGVLRGERPASRQLRRRQLGGQGRRTAVLHQPAGDFRVQQRPAAAQPRPGPDHRGGKPAPPGLLIEPGPGASLTRRALGLAELPDDHDLVRAGIGTLNVRDAASVDGEQVSLHGPAAFLAKVFGTATLWFDITRVGPDAVAPAYIAESPAGRVALFSSTPE